MEYTDVWTRQGPLECWWQQNAETIMEMANFKYTHALWNAYVVDIFFLRGRKK